MNISTTHRMPTDEDLQLLLGIGLTHKEKETILITDEPKIPGYSCFPNEVAKQIFNTRDVFGQGFDTNRKKARIKAIAECLERLCLYNPIDELFIQSNYHSSRDFAKPSSFCSYSEEQVDKHSSFLRECNRNSYKWFPTTEILTKQRVCVPGQLVYISDSFTKEFPIRRERISTGTALGRIGTNEALKSGFLEAIERDACISAYLTRRNLKKIINLPPNITDLIKYIKRYNLEVNVFDVTTDLKVPTILAITLDHTGIGAAVNAGSAASFDYTSAIERAVLESIQYRRTGRIMKAVECPDRLPREDEITSMDARFYYWHGLERIKDLRFWLDSPININYADLEKENASLEKSLNLLRAKKYHIYIADITLPKVRDAGFEVLKVLIPELHPLYLDERSKFLYSVHYGAIKDDKGLKPHMLT